MDELKGEEENCTDYSFRDPDSSREKSCLDDGTKDHGEMKTEVNESNARILLVEPFYGGSHKQLVDLISEDINGCVKFCMTAKKWHWRMRSSALYFSQVIPPIQSYRVLFASSVLNLAELVALRPDLGKLKKVLYFHENQLVYPVRKHQDRDFQYGYNQILSSLVADLVIFNSTFNMESFLTSIKSFLKVMPDYRPKDLAAQIRPKCSVLYFPLSDNIILEKQNPSLQNKTYDQNNSNPPLHIVWPHRWEHDKGPELFFQVLDQLMENQLAFKVSVIGQTFSDVPEIFGKSKEKLGDHVINWGYLPARDDYISVLQEADVVVSTAKHEFFGVAMLEAVQCKCYPLCPKALVYPEIFSDENLYSTPQQLFKKLRNFCRNPHIARNMEVKISLEKYSWRTLKCLYKELLDIT